MAKFYGNVGYASETVEVSPGVWDDVPVVFPYYGDVIRNSRRFEDGQKYNGDISVGNSISIVSDAYAREHFFAIRYVMWQGVPWIVEDVTVEHPRLVLRLGGKYDGPVGSPNPSDGT